MLSYPNNEIVNSSGVEAGAEILYLPNESVSENPEIPLIEITAPDKGVFDVLSIILPFITAPS